MPIAHCVVSSECRDRGADLLALWSNHSGVSPDEMTITLAVSDRQYGKSYAVMATLYLPSIWSAENISRLQLGLSAALAEYFMLALEQVHVITTIVESGCVVEAGSEQRW